MDQKALGVVELLNVLLEQTNQELRYLCERNIIPDFDTNRNSMINHQRITGAYYYRIRHRLCGPGKWLMRSRDHRMRKLGKKSCDLVRGVYTSVYLPLSQQATAKADTTACIRKAEDGARAVIEEARRLRADLPMNLS
jgi:hypothetical protein